MLYDRNIIDNIKEPLSTEKLTLSVAESVTAGHLQAAFSSATEASKFSREELLHIMQGRIQSI